MESFENQEKEWTENDRITIDGFQLGISLRREHANIWLSEDATKDDIDTAFSELVQEGFLRLPTKGDDAGSWGKIFWETTSPVSVKEIINKLKQKGLQVERAK